MVVGGVLLPIVLFGKNLFCKFVCPYGGLMVLMNKLTGKNIQLRQYRVWLVRLRLVLLFLTLAIIFYTNHIGAVMFEPFGVAFSLSLD